MRPSMMKISFFMLITTLVHSALIGQGQTDTTDYRRILEYVRTNIPDVPIERVTLWTTSTALDKTHVAKDMIKSKSRDLVFPFDRSWLVMIDDNPEANFGHPVRWVFINADFSGHSEIYKKDFPPLIFSDGGKGKSIDFKCINLTPIKCVVSGSVFHPAYREYQFIDHRCKFAVLVSGGINSGSNYSRYPQNLKSMYNMLRIAGFPKSQIYVYYADGSTNLDCDNTDNDNNDNTGNDVTGGAIEADIRARIDGICATSNNRRDILVTYFTNHGSDDQGACLWDITADGLDDAELYSPAELAEDAANCAVLKHFMIHDQCYAGEFLTMAADGHHNNLVVYAAATASEVSWGREYMAQWEQNDITSTTINAMHQDVVTNGNLTSTAGMTEGTAGIGNHILAQECRETPWWRKYWYWILPFIFIPVLVIWARRGRNRQPG